MLPLLNVAPWFFDQLRVILVRPRNPLNIGAAARAMSNFGFRHLRLVAPWEPSFLDARSAVGASQLLQNAQVYGSVAEAVADCGLVVGTTAVGDRELQHPLHLLQQGAELIQQQALASPVAVMFGSEKFGLSNEEMSHCHWLMSIPMSTANISMNLGQAVAVTLYELVRGGAAVIPPKETIPAQGAEVEMFIQLLLDSLRASGYIKPKAEAATENKVRRLVRRLNLEASDAETWLGMLRQIFWKITHPAPLKD